MERREFQTIEEFKKEYKKFQEKYNLPNFTELNKLFDIEELDMETEFLLRKVRRIISDRIGSYLKFIEIMMNPVNSTFFFLKLVQKLDDKDKKVLSEINETLGKAEIELISLDLDYSEEKEAEFIKKIFEIFYNDTRIKLIKIAEKLNNGNHIKKEPNKERSYFG